MSGHVGFLFLGMSSRDLEVGVPSIHRASAHSAQLLRGFVLSTGARAAASGNALRCRPGGEVSFQTLHCRCGQKALGRVA